MSEDARRFENKQDENSYAALKLELLETLDKRFNEQVERSQTLLSNSIKIVATTLGIAISILTVLGIKTVLDLDEVAREAMHIEIRELVKENDPNLAYGEEVRRIYQESILQRYIYQIARADVDENSDPIQVSNSDLNQFLSIVGLQDTSIAIFKDVVRVFAKAELDEVQQSKVSEAFTRQMRSYVDSKDPQPYWAHRIEVLLKESTLSGTALLPFSIVRECMTSTNTSFEVFEASLAFITRFDDTGARSTLREIGKREDKHRARYATVARAKLSPDSSTLKEWAKELSVTLENASNYDKLTMAAASLTLLATARAKNVLRPYDMRRMQGPLIEIIDILTRSSLGMKTHLGYYHYAFEGNSLPLEGVGYHYRYINEVFTWRASQHLRQGDLDMFCRLLRFFKPRQVSRNPRTYVRASLDRGDFLVTTANDTIRATEVVDSKIDLVTNCDNGNPKARVDVRGSEPYYGELVSMKFSGSVSFNNPRK